MKRNAASNLLHAPQRLLSGQEEDTVAAYNPELAGSQTAYQHLVLTSAPVFHRVECDAAWTLGAMGKRRGSDGFVRSKNVNAMTKQTIKQLQQLVIDKQIQVKARGRFWLCKSTLQAACTHLLCASSASSWHILPTADAGRSQAPSSTAA